MSAMKAIPLSTAMEATRATLRPTSMEFAQALPTAIHIVLNMTVATIVTSKDTFGPGSNNGHRGNVYRGVAGVILIFLIAGRGIGLIAIAGRITHPFKSARGTG